MRRFAHRPVPATVGALVLAAAAFTLTGSDASAATVTVDLCALPGTATLTGSATVPIWGFGVPSTPGDCSTATATRPGPQLVVDEGDAVTLRVVNALPAGHTLTLEAPGIDFAAGPTDAPVGGTVSRTFTAAPGTYLYRSAGDAGRQQAMGLAGALVVRSATAGRAYPSPATAYDVAATVILDAVDPAFDLDPDNFDLTAFTPTYWLIDGKAYPDAPDVTAAPGQRVLLRYLNAGPDNTTMMLLGVHERIVARSGHLLNNPMSVAAETVPAGATADAIVTMPSTAAPSPHGFPLFNRQLHLTNGAQTASDPTPAAGGGMLTFIHT